MASAVEISQLTLSSTLNPHSCRYCSKFRIPHTNRKHRQSFSYSEVEVAGKDGCTLFESRRCMLLPLDHYDIQDLRLVVEHDPDDLDFMFLTFTWYINNEFFEGLRDEYRKEGGSELSAIAIEGNPAAQYFLSRPPNETTESPETITRVQEWLRKCRKKHSNCRKLAANPPYTERPTRLIALAPQGSHESEHVRLLEMSSDSSVDYVALSYCWGAGNQKGMCHRSNLRELEQGIKVSDLPATIQDAVQVSRALGFEYLWVDRLCIIQIRANEEDEELKKELQKELGKMAGIYMNASLVISAAKAKSSNEGFLQTRKLSGEVWKIICGTEEEEPGFILLYEEASENDSVEEIDKRAWTLQEHLMSIRLLKFGSKQVEWICQNSELVDGGSSMKLDHLDQKYFTGRPRDLLFQSDPHESAVQNLSNWMQLLTKYSERTISKQSDRLPAFSMVATQFRNVMQWKSSSYRAGLWLDDLPMQLLWFRSSERVVLSDLSKADHSSVPSWSWASMTSPFQYGHPRYLWEHHLTNIWCETTLTDPENPYGTVNLGHLAVTGFVNEVKWTGEIFVHMDRHSSNHTELLASTRTYWDSSAPEFSSSLWLLRVIFQNQLPAGLILAAAKNGFFKRVGYFEYCLEPPEGNPSLHYVSEIIKTSVQPSNHGVKREMKII